MGLTIVKNGKEVAKVLYLCHFFYSDRKREKVGCPNGHPGSKGRRCPNGHPGSKEEKVSKWTPRK